MAKGKSTWKYNKLLTARRNYFDEGGDTNSGTSGDTTGGSSTPINWGSTEGWLALGSNVAAGIGNMVNNIVATDVTDREKQLLAGVNSAQLSGVEDDSVSKFLSDYKSYNPLGYVNKDQLGAVGAGQAAGNAIAAGTSGAAAGMSFGPWGAAIGAGVGLLTSAFGSIGRNAKARKAAKRVNEAIDLTNEFNERSLANRASNVSTAQVNNLEANYAAFGGDLLTHGSNFDTGVTLIGNGGTHEENPNEGVPMGMDAEGTPNLVEEGEVIFNDYVFSNRLKVPKEVRKKYKLRGAKPLTFAEAATQMSKESEERPNDPISKAGLEDSMMKLMIAQEQVRAKNEKNRFAKGGKIARRYDDGSQLLLDRPIDTSDLSWMEGLNLTDEDITQTDWWKNEIAPLAGPIDPATTIASIGDSTAYPNPEAVPTETREVLGSPTPRKTKTTRSGNGLAPTWMRYVPAFASGIMSITDAAGLTNKPDYSEADMVLDTAREAGNYSPVGFSPIGNYLEYTPFDREFYINQMNAQAGATRRAILNTSGGNRATAMAGILAADNNYLGQLGNLARQAEEYNLAQRQKAKEFNRATNMFNTEGALKADMANQEASLKARDSYLKGTLSAAELRQRERQQAAAARSANLSNFINSLGDIGRENFARNMIVSDPSKYYSIGANGEISYKASFDDLSEAEQDYVRGHASRKSQGKKARGRYLTRKKRR